MEWRFIERFAGVVCQNTSARIMIRCIDSTNGQANLRVLEVTEIKAVPYVPLSHPFVERLIGTVRREYLDRILFWTKGDLETKLLDFQHYYNGHRTHAGLEAPLPAARVRETPEVLKPAGNARDEIERELTACRRSIQSRSLLHELTLVMRRGLKDPELARLEALEAKFDAAVPI